MAGIDQRFSAPKGISDALPPRAAVVYGATSYFAELAALYGYSPIDTPIIEKTEVFERSVGGTSDIVTKQMYTFEDKSGESVTLRPEGTAGVVRSFVEHEIYKAEALPWRVFYVGDMFRYERPQAGRYRQFKQVGAEALGAAEPEADVEQIEMCLQYLDGLGVASPRLVINSIGDGACRPAYLDALGRFLASQEIGGALCEECRTRAKRNPLRVLDCKKPGCKEATAEAPAALDYLCEQCKRHFEGVTAGLDALTISYDLDKRLVRGLDYYTRTAFEVVSGGLDAAQDAVAGGGRYDGLVELFGGPPTPAVGFAVGLDRSLAAAGLVRTTGARSDRTVPGTTAPERSRTGRRGRPRFEPGEFSPDVVVVGIEDGARIPSIRLASQLRRLGLSAFVAPVGRSLKSQMKHADRAGAAAAAVLGPEELSRGEVTVRLLHLPEVEGRKQLTLGMAGAAKSLAAMLARGPEVRSQADSQSRESVP